MTAPGGRARHEIAEQIDVREPNGVATASTLDEPVGQERRRHEQ